MKTELITPPDTQPELPAFPRFYRHKNLGAESIWVQISHSAAIRIHLKNSQMPFDFMDGELAFNWDNYTPVTTPFTIKFTP